MSQVVIGDILPYTQATAIASQTVFGTNWTANFESDVVVYQTPVGDEPDDFIQKLQFPSEYSVTFIGAEQEVQITLVTPATAGDIITITRQTPADRTNLYSNTNFLPSMLNNDFGILTLVDQQAQLVNQKIGPRYNYSATIIDIVDTILPLLGPNQTWIKNGNNTAIEAIDLPSGGFAPALSTYVTVGDETDDLPESFRLLAGTNVTLTPGTNTLTVSVTGQNILPGLETNIAYYQADGTTLSPILTANNSVFVTDDFFNPGWSTTLPAGLTIPYPLIYGTNGNLVAEFNDETISPDWLLLKSGSTAGSAAGLFLMSTDADASMQLLAKGGGGVEIGSTGGTSTQPMALTDGIRVFAFSIPTWTADRTVTMRDSSGTMAYLSDIPAVSPSALTTGDDTNVTLTLGGTPSTALLQAVSITAGWTGTLSATRGGTAQSTYITGDTLYASGVNTLAKLAGNITTAKQYLSQTGSGVVSAAPAWATIAGADITGAALTKTDDTNVTLTLAGSPTTALLRAASLTLGWTGQLSLTRGGTNASLTASNGGIVYSTASALGIIPGTATAGQMLRSGASTTPAWSTNTFPNTTPVSNLLYASSANVIGNLATANSAYLTTNSSGVPAWVNSPSTYTPTITFTTPGDLSVSYASQQGSYYRIGNMIVLRLYVEFTPTYTTASGIFVISLPVAAIANPSFGGSCFNFTANTIYPAGCTFLVPVAIASTSNIFVNGAGSAVATASFTTTNVPSGVSHAFSIALIYLV